MVALVIAFPQMVMHYKKSGVQLNQEQINQQFDKIGLPDMSAPGGLPGLDLSQPPKIE